MVGPVRRQQLGPQAQTSRRHSRQCCWFAHPWRRLASGGGQLPGQPLRHVSRSPGRATVEGELPAQVCSACADAVATWTGQDVHLGPAPSGDSERWLRRRYSGSWRYSISRDPCERAAPVACPQPPAWCSIRSWLGNDGRRGRATRSRLAGHRAEPRLRRAGPSALGTGEPTGGASGMETSLVSCGDVVISPGDHRPQSTQEVRDEHPVPPISYCRRHRRLVVDRPMRRFR